MSLQIWLPMTKDLKNQGIADVEITNNGATLDSAGKLGGCYYFNRSASNYLKISNPLTSSLNEISMAFWVKLPSNGSVNDQLVHIGNGSGWNNNRFTCFVRANNPFLVFVCGDGSSSTTYSCVSSHLTLNQWTHIVCTYNNGTMRIYLNGVLNKEYITNIVPSFANTPYIGIGAGPNSTEPATAYLNDVRIYSHCLSQKEISELKKALVLHYCLDNNGVGNKNLLGGTNDFFNIYNSNPSNQTIITDENDGIYLKSIPTSADWSKVVFKPYFPASEIVGKVITVSCEIRGHDLPSSNVSNYTYLTLEAFSSLSSNSRVGNRDYLVASSLLKENKWTKISYQRTISFDEWSVMSNYSVNDFNYISLSLYNHSGKRVDFRKAKVEIGDKATPWCPNSSDALYTALGYDDGIEYDTSGYGNNGTKVGTLNYSTDSPRYLASTVFDGTNNISFPIALGGQKDCTIAFWAKPNTTNASGCMLSLERNTYWQFTFYGSHLEIRDSSTGYTGTRKSYSIGTLVANTWTHICVTYSSGILKIYRDGEMLSANTVGGTNLCNELNEGRVGSAMQSGYFWSGNISDVRVYASCLSDTEIQKLYTVSASIDSNGNAYSAAYVEG